MGCPVSQNPVREKYSNIVINLFTITAIPIRLRLTLSWRRPLLYRNPSMDLQSKSMDWFLYDNDLRHERVNPFDATGFFLYPLKTSKTRSFFMFSGGYKRDYWHEIGNFFCNRKYINERPSKCMQSLRNVCPRFK